MRRIFSFVLVLLVFITILPMTVYAEDKSENVVYFEDGSYLTIFIDKEYLRASGSQTGRKTYQYTDSDGDIAWKVVLNGTFTYTGSSAQCISSSVDVTLYISGWYVVSESAGKSGSSATGNVTMGLKMLGVTIKKVPLTMTLTCDANGNLS